MRSLQKFYALRSQFWARLRIVPVGAEVSRASATPLSTASARLAILPTHVHFSDRMGHNQTSLDRFPHVRILWWRNFLRGAACHAQNGELLSRRSAESFGPRCGRTAFCSSSAPMVFMIGTALPTNLSFRVPYPHRSLIVDANRLAGSFG